LLGQDDATLDGTVTGTGTESTVSVLSQNGELKTSLINTVLVDSFATNLVGKTGVGTISNPIVIDIPQAEDAQFATEGAQAFINNDSGSGVSDAAEATFGIQDVMEPPENIRSVGLVLQKLVKLPK